MNGIYKHYIIDLSCNNNFVQIPTMQGDGNGVRGVEIELIENGVQYIIDNTVTGVYIIGTKPDTKQVLNECTITPEGYILVDITSQMSAIAGRGDYQIMLIDREKNSQLKSFPLYILTTSATFDVSEIISSDEYQALTKTLGDVSVITQEAIEKIENIDELQIEWQTAENQRIENENIRIVNEENRNSTEDERNKNEEIRISNEKKRIESEDARINHENTRIESEKLRESNELDRNNNENQRNINEENRISSENIRKDNEIIREKSESKRISDEDIRNKNESIREKNEQTRITNEESRNSNLNNALSNVQNAIANSTSATSNCVTATDRANDIAQDLEEKRDSNYYKGEKGDPGIIYTIDSWFAFQLEGDDLVLYYHDEQEAPNFEIDEAGNLIYDIPETNTTSN